jgi:hypothetical protein
MSLLLCRFSDAGMPRPSRRGDSRRPKSAKAGNRGVWGTDGAAGAMGIWGRRECWGSWADAGDRIALARILGVRAGANERIARCSTGFAERSRASLADGRKRVCCRARAGQNGAIRCGAGSAMTASRGVDPDLGRRGRGSVLWLAASREGLDDEHASAAAGARSWQHAGFVGRWGL